MKLFLLVAKGMEDIKGFLAWLSPAERRAHELGALMLGTSYDVVKTHGYQKYLEAMRLKIEKPPAATEKPLAPATK